MERKWAAGLLWLGVGLGLAMPRLLEGAYGVQGDLSLHVHITRAFARSAAEGVWLPRWAGVLDGGRGDALFTFYPPLSYLLGALLMKLPGVGTLGALKLLSVSILVLGQAGAYRLARGWFERGPSLLASAAYAALPAIPLLALNRNFLANALGVALAPWVLAGVRDLLAGRRNAAIPYALALCALLFSHLLTAYLCGLAVGGLTLCMWRQAGWRGWARLTGASLLAVAMMAFFLVPQAVEAGWVQLGLQTARQDYRHYFLFARAAEGAYQQTWSGLNLVISLVTLAQTGLSLGLAVLVWRRGDGATRRRGEFLLHAASRSVVLLWAGALAAACLLISLPWSEPLWRWLPGLKFIQFPWRALPFASLGGGLLLAEAASRWAELPRARRLAAAPVLGALLLLNLFFTWMLVRPYDTGLDRAGVARVLAAPGVERMSFAESLRVQAQAGGDRRMLAYTANQPYFRPAGADLDYYPPSAEPGGLTVLGGGCRATPERIANEERRFAVECENAGRARLETYAYPHWTARLDGQPLRIEAEPGSGLMLLALPAGRHRLEVRFEPRHPAERQARGLSLLAWGGFLVLALAGIVQRKTNVIAE